MNLPPINQLPLTVDQRSLLRAARLIHHAHDEARQDTIRAGGVFPSWLEQDCATLLLLAVTPLPRGSRSKAPHRACPVVSTPCRRRSWSCVDCRSTRIRRARRGWS